MSITEFLLARIDEDEAVARERAALDPTYIGVWRHGDAQDFIVAIAAYGPKSVARVTNETLGSAPASWAWSSRLGEYIEVHGPDTTARVLAECATKRAIMASCREDHEDAMANGDDTTALASEVLYALAAVYADHPDYDPGWAL